MQRILFSALLSLLIAKPMNAQEETSVLFIGNSFTFMNGMPSMFKEIALAKGKTIFVDSIVQEGQDLKFHASRKDTYDKIHTRKWDYIVLQAHSNELAQPESKIDANTLPFAKQIVDSIRANSPHTQLVLYMTWAYKFGNPKWAPIASYDSMQLRIKTQYLRFADILDARVSPVGEVWKSVRSQYDGVNLYYEDNRHPSPLGSYLSACTHFTSIFGESPYKNSAHIVLDDASKRIIELNASQVVLNNLNQWRNVPRKDQLEAGFDLILQNDTLSLVNRAKNATWVEWNFGDGHISADENPIHCYNQKGTFVVTQKITNAHKTIELKREISIK